MQSAREQRVDRASNATIETLSTRSGTVLDGLVVPEPPWRGEVSRLAGGRIAAAGVSALWFVIVARSLSIDDFGSLALLLGLGMMLSIITDLGLSSLLADAVARMARSRETEPAS